MNIQKHFLSKNFFILSIFILGIVFFYNDYGVDFDEYAYKNNSLIVYNLVKDYLIHNKINELEFFEQINSNTGKITNVFYFIVFIIRDLIKNFVTIEIYKLANLLNYIFFCIGLFFFFKTIKKRFENRLYAYLGLIVLLASPRIFSESFYNNRDIFFLSLNLILLYFSQNLFLKNNYKDIFLFSIILGLCLNVRFFSMVSLFFCLIIYFLEYFQKIKTSQLILRLLLISILPIVFLILTTPYLWENFFETFGKFYFKDISDSGDVRITNIFLGNLYPSTFSPWYYYIVWIFFTTPFVFILLSSLGILYKIIFFLHKIFNLDLNKNIWSDKKQLFDFYILITLVFFLFFVSEFSPSKFDGWRHIYFLYPFIILNIFFILEWLKKKIFYFNTIILILFITSSINLYWTFKNKPYGFVYFNFFEKKLKQNSFDYDYWGVTNHKLIQFIINDLDNNSKESVTIGTISFNNLLPHYYILSEDQKKRIKIVDQTEKPEYLIDNFRIPYKLNNYSNKKDILQFYKNIFEINVDGNIIAILYKIR